MEPKIATVKVLGLTRTPHSPDDEVDIVDLKSTVWSDADIKTVISACKGKMKQVAGVTGTSVDNVVAFVRSLRSS